MGSLVCPHPEGYVSSVSLPEVISLARHNFEKTLRELNIRETDFWKVKYSRLNFLFCPKCKAAELNFLRGNIADNGYDMPICTDTEDFHYTERISSERASKIRSFFKEIMQKMLFGQYELVEQLGMDKIPFDYFAVIFCKKCPSLQFYLLSSEKKRSKFIDGLLEQ